MRDLRAFQSRKSVEEASNDARGVGGGVGGGDSSTATGSAGASAEGP